VQTLIRVSLDDETLRQLRDVAARERRSTSEQAAVAIAVAIAAALQTEPPPPLEAIAFLAELVDRAEALA
jgi:hypothetical protein